MSSSILCGDPLLNSIVKFMPMNNGSFDEHQNSRQWILLTQNIIMVMELVKRSIGSFDEQQNSC